MLKRVLLHVWLMLFVLGIGTAFALPTVDLGASEAAMVGSKGPNAARIPMYLTNSEKSTDACTGLPIDLALTAIGLNIQYDPGILEFFKAESALAEKVADSNVTDPGVPNVKSANLKVVISGGVVELPYANTPTLIGYVYFNVKEDVVTATPVITNVINVPDQAATPGRPAQTCTIDDPGQKSQRINLITGTNCSLTVLPSDPTAGPLNVHITGGTGFSEIGIDPAGFSWDPLMYNVGNKVILTAAPEIGFRFSHWTGGCTGADNPYTLVMPAGPVDCTANFEPEVNNQSITVTTPAPASALYNSSFTVAATVGSGLDVAYSSGTPAVCTNAGATFTMISGTGSCEVRYNQAGDAIWLSAPQVINTVNAAKAPLTITADNKSKIEGSANPPLSVTYSGFVGGDTAAGLTTPATASTTAVTDSPAGSYPISVSGGASGNYTISHVAGTLTVVPLVLTVTAVNMQTGSGFVVNKSPISPTIACPGTCTTNYPYGTTVELSAVPSWHSAGLWTGCNSVVGMDCSVTMNSDFGLTANFIPFLTVLRSGLTSGEYNTIQSAYDDSADGDLLLIQEVASQTFLENLSLHLPVNIKLIGGIDSAYRPSAGFTVVKGSLKISAGKVSVDRIKIR